MVLGIIKNFTATVLICAIPYLGIAADHPEKWYQEKWCKKAGGKIEYTLPDRTRCDCLTDTHAIEFDFGVKFYQAIGQSLYYSLQTGKKAGIVLILEKPTDRKYWIRLNSTIEHFKLPIDVWEMGLKG